MKTTADQHALAALRASIRWGECPTCEGRAYKFVIQVQGWGWICRDCLGEVIAVLVREIGGEPKPGVER